MRAETVTGSAIPVVSTDTVATYVQSVLEQVESLPKSTARRIDASLPGLAIEVDSFDDAMADAIRDNFIRLSAAVPFPALEMTVSVCHGVAGHAVPATWSPHELYQPHRVAQALEAAGLRASYYFDLDHWHIYHPARGFAVQLMRGPGQYPPWETGAPLRPFLHWHYARRGMRLAHSGTLGIGDRGVLLAGAGGSGKSATVIAGLLNGMQSVGDDYVLLRAENDGVSACPLYATLKQDPAGYRRLGLRRRLPEVGLNWQGKHQFRIDDIASGAVPARMAIGAILVPRIGNAGQTMISPLPRAEAMMALAASSIQQMPGERENGFRFFGEVTRRLPCFRLDLGQEPREIADAIGAFIRHLRP